jgi:hypothetical protein
MLFIDTVRRSKQWERVTLFDYILAIYDNFVSVEW